jgi:hypothetical protein
MPSFIKTNKTFVSLSNSLKSKCSTERKDLLIKKEATLILGLFLGYESNAIFN